MPWNRSSLRDSNKVPGPIFLFHPFSFRLMRLCFGDKHGAFVSSLCTSCFMVFSFRIHLLVLLVAIYLSELFSRCGTTLLLCESWRAYSVHACLQMIRTDAVFHLLTDLSSWAEKTNRWIAKRRVLNRFFFGSWMVLYFFRSLDLK